MVNFHEMFRTLGQAQEFHWGTSSRSLSNVQCQELCQGDYECQCWTRQNKKCYLYKNKPAWNMPAENGKWSGARECKGAFERYK